jgi:peptidoglycan/xylan/chitin deacetylase (PgdA/CDA1 family)
MSDENDAPGIVSLPEWVKTGVRRRVAPATLVLVYHRVVPEKGQDINHLQVSVERFAAHLAWLGEHARVLTPAELLERVRHPQRTKWALDGGKPRVAISFDDGYADNVQHALPVLRERGMKATVFVVTDRVNAGGLFWWDALERIVCEGRPAEGWKLPNGMRVQRGEDLDQAFAALHAVLKPMSLKSRTSVLVDLAAQSAVSLEVRDDSRPMTWDELREWHTAGMGVGSHSCTHAQLTQLGEDDLAIELMQSRHMLESELGERITMLAYPYGGRVDYNARVEEMAEEAAYECAFTVCEGNVRWARSRFAVPRCQVGDWAVDELAAAVKRWSA